MKSVREKIAKALSENPKFINGDKDEAFWETLCQWDEGELAALCHCLDIDTNDQANYADWLYGDLNFAADVEILAKAILEEKC